jgi:hypothetical protein
MTMRMRTAALIGVVGISLCGCVSYHQEVAALRMPRPAAGAPGLSAYAAANPDYPSVGGNILKGSAPVASATYDATRTEPVP